MRSRNSRVLIAAVLASAVAGTALAADREIGREIAVRRHLQDGEESVMSAAALIAHGERLFSANWTIQEGGGRPGTKGSGAPLSDAASPLVFPRNFNRISAPDANSCAGCHNAPFAHVGGGGDIVTNVFVQGQRFDFATFDPHDAIATRGALDERGTPATAATIANSRNSLGMFGAGFIEMLARQMTFDLQRQRDSLGSGGAIPLRTKGVAFGTLARRADGSWDTSRVEGIPAQSLAVGAAGGAPSLIIRPFHQSGSVPSLRVFTNNAFNHHHGIQPSERFGDGLDPDGDGFVDELTRADVTAATLFQATLPVPGRVIPNSPRIAAAIRRGEQLFAHMGCTSCHLPSLPLEGGGRVFSEPGPFNPAGNAQPATTRVVRVDLTDPRLPLPRLRATGNVVHVPAYTDLKLHDITSGPADPDREPLDMNQPLGSPAFFAGNSKFITRKLWGVANEPPYFHHGQYTTLREAVLAHDGEARVSGTRFRSLRRDDQDNVIEFLKSLQVLPPGTPHRIVDEHGRPRAWP
jgi:cytochrome c peroxidase